MSHNVGNSIFLPICHTNFSRKTINSARLIFFNRASPSPKQIKEKPRPPRKRSPELNQEYAPKIRIISPTQLSPPAKNPKKAFAPAIAVFFAQRVLCIILPYLCISFSNLFLNSKKSIVFCNPFPSCRSTNFNLGCTNSYCKI